MYQMMLAIIVGTWAVFLWRCADSENPLEHVMFIDITIWVNLTHGILMGIGALIMGGNEYWHLVGDIPMLLYMGLVTLYLRAGPTCSTKPRDIYHAPV